MIRWIFVLGLSFQLMACATGTVGFVNSKYQEIPKRTLAEEMENAIGGGAKVTVISGQNDQLDMNGQGGVYVGGFFPKDNWQFDVGVSVESYESLSYNLEIVKGGTTTHFSQEFTVANVTLDIAGSYRWNFFRPYLGLRRDSYTMTPKNFSFSGPNQSITTSAVFGIGGVSLDFEISKAWVFSVRGDYATNITQSDSVDTANKVSYYATLSWGWDKR